MLVFEGVNRLINAKMASYQKIKQSFPQVHFSLKPPPSIYHYVYMAGVQNSRSKGSYKVGPIGIEKLILHLRYEAGPIGNHAVPKLGASIALAWR